MIRFCLVLVIVGLVSCTPSVEQKEIYSVLYDTTDKLDANPEADVLWQFMDGNNSEKHLTFRYAMLSDVDMNVVQQLKRLAVASGLFANAVSEQKRLKSFKLEFMALLEKEDSIGALHSAIFKPILSELDYLTKQSNTDKKHLIVYSNLVENSYWLSFYKSNDLWLLRNQSDEIIKRYLEQVPKEASFKNVTLHIVFKPSDYNDNIRFKQLRDVYIKVFKHLDVPIRFSANLTNAQHPL